MNDFDTDLDFYDVEVITNKRCRECNDKLAPWESTLCCICEAMSEED